MTESRRFVETQAHEFTANFNYNEAGLAPWFAFDRLVKQAGGSFETTMEAFGVTWEVVVYYQEGNLLAPESGTTPAGATISHETIREFRVQLKAIDGGNADRSVNYHVRPRWMGMEAESSDGVCHEIPVPESLANTQTDAVNVKMSGSNIEFTRYDDLLREAAKAVDVNPAYFGERHETSNVQDAARYVRVNRDASGPIHSRTGPLAGLAHVLETDREGYRKLVQNDDDERGRNRPGYQHTVTLGPTRIREVFPGNSVPVEIKHYYSLEAVDRDPSDALAHPKLEVSYQVGRWDGKANAATDSDLEELSEELDDWVYSVLTSAGLDVRAGVPGQQTFVEDEYFEATNGTTTATAAELDVTQVRHEQESVVFKHLGGGLSPVEQETLQTLVTDGGEVTPTDIAEENDRHPDSVRRALRRMNDLVEYQYDDLALKSTYVAELVADKLEQAKEAVTDATMATVEAKEAARRGLDEATSAFLAWREKHVSQWEDHDEAPTVDLGEASSVHEVKQLLREGLDLWTETSHNPATFRQGRVVYRIDEKRVVMDIWKRLNTKARSVTTGG